MTERMTFRIANDEVSVALNAFAESASPADKQKALHEVGHELAEEIASNIEHERQYDGKPMKSPAKKTRLNGRFAASYKYRYLKSYRNLDSKERKAYKETGRAGRRKVFYKGRDGATPKVKGRVAVTASSKQLQFTGGTINSIDILTLSPSRVSVGGTTGHSNAILSYHNATRKPAGISDEFADRAVELIWKRIKRKM